MMKPLLSAKSMFIDWSQKSFGAASTDRGYERARLLVQIFYFIQFTVAYQAFTYNSQLPYWSEIVDSGAYFTPLWPVNWIGYLDYQLAVKSIMLGFLVFSFLCMLFWSKNRLIRILNFLSIFFYLALISSFGKIDHYLHLMMLSSAFLIFLPLANKAGAFRTDFIRIIWFNQLLILLTYSISGFFKFYGILDQLIKGQVSALSPSGLGYNVAKTVFYTGQPTFFSEIILENPSFLHVIVLLAGYTVELGAVYFAFFPRYHRLAAVLLIGIHTGIALTVGPDFYYQILLVGVFFLISPFSKTD